MPLLSRNSSRFSIRLFEVCPETGARYFIQSLCIGLVRVYQLLISPILPGSCRFLPSCSEYAIQAFGVHGPLRGLGLTAWRILRCHPLARGGYDPVPPARGKEHEHRSRFSDAPFQR